jgi:hypothetical protein
VCSTVDAATAEDSTRADQAGESHYETPKTQGFGSSQFVLAGDPIVQPLDYGKGRMLPSAEDYSSDESGSIYDIVFGGIQNNLIEFEIQKNQI